MKCIFRGLFLLCPYLIFGSNVFPTENTIWSEIRIFYGIAPGTGATEKHTYSIEKDTVINNIDYSLLFYSYDLFVIQNVITGNTTTYKDPNKICLGGIRKDDKKVYFYLFENVKNLSHLSELSSMDENEENIIYDFDVAVGDTLFWKHSLWEDFSVVISIDSTEINDGSIKRRINFGINGNVKDRWIEGVGSDKGLFGAYKYKQSIGHSPHLFCCTSNDTDLYDTNFFEGCNTDFDLYLPPPIENPNYDGPVIIYPNPFENELSLKLPSGEEFLVKIFSIDGALKFDEIISSSKNIDTSNYARGFYILMIFDQNNDIHSITKINRE